MFRVIMVGDADAYIRMMLRAWESAKSPKVLSLRLSDILKLLLQRFYFPELG
jgi:hypothetical protein